MENSVEKGVIAQMSNFTFFHNVFYGICILKSYNSHISVVVCNFFEYGKVSKWETKEQVKLPIITRLNSLSHDPDS